ncbi:hypothetical protein L484_006438 [Morus notabilis]|uniref:Uncharacterized protein n=1 Tax=Morus notabilis TaxID=981085 RepID=W9SD94_9ROSA|nr:hypothetical protein L484_006438 [Morus notabilis]
MEVLSYGGEADTQIGGGGTLGGALGRRLQGQRFVRQWWRRFHAGGSIDSSLQRYDEVLHTYLARNQRETGGATLTKSARDIIT